MITDYLHEDWKPPEHLQDIADVIEEWWPITLPKKSPEWKLLKKRYNELVMLYNKQSKIDAYKLKT